MPRLGSRGGVLALLGMLGATLLACNKQPDASTRALGSPNASVAGRESASPSSRSNDASTAGAGGFARSLVAVAAISPGDAQPCERTCGRVGDCLLETGEVGEFQAGRLELECLDLCVHSSTSAAPHSAFLACEQQAGCGELLGCARSNWDALVASRSGPSVQGVTTGGDACAEGCRWLLSCIYTNMPPNQGYLGPEYEEQLRGCETQCEILSPNDREIYVRYRDCLRNNCAADRLHVCFEY